MPLSHACVDRISASGKGGSFNTQISESMYLFPLRIFAANPLSPHAGGHRELGAGSFGAVACNFGPYAKRGLVKQSFRNLTAAPFFLILSYISLIGLCWAISGYASVA